MTSRFLIGFFVLCAVAFIEVSVSAQDSSHNTGFSDGYIDVETAPISDESFNTAFRRLKSQDQLQFDLADAPPPPKLDWLEKILAPLFKFLVALLPLFKVLFWVFVVSGVCLLLYIVGLALWNFRAARRNKAIEKEHAATLYRPSGTKARILLAEVDALAAQGLYAEAVHQLLFRSIQDIAFARPNMIRRSFTSREIARLSELAPETRTAFSLIANEVERSHFGGRSLDYAAFQRCRKAYAQFAVPEEAVSSLTPAIGAPA